MPPELANANYLSLTTFRRDGRAVATPVWFAEDAGALYVFSARDAGKVKRLRNSSKAQVALCNARGGLLGSAHAATATLIDASDDVAAALGALRRKYGFQMKFTDFLSRLTGKFAQRQYIKVHIDE